jgi:hypothetical protein
MEVRMAMTTMIISSQNFISIHDDERSAAVGADAVQHAFRDNEHSTRAHRDGGTVADEIHSSRIEALKIATRRAFVRMD